MLKMNCCSLLFLLIVLLSFCSAGRAQGYLEGPGYGPGLADKSPTPSEYQSYNRSISLNVGYSLHHIVGAFKRT